MLTATRPKLDDVFSRNQLAEMAALANLLNETWRRMDLDPESDETCRNAVADAWHALNDVLRLSGVE